MSDLTKIGKYDIIRELGAGGMATVYLANDPDIDRRVAIKLIRQEYARNPELLRRFMQEARAIGRLDHPNIVRIFNIEGSSEGAYIVMEFLEGKTLEHAILERTISGDWNPSIKQKVGYLIDACKGLRYAHNNGVIHRDIKPSNLFVTRNNTVKILDFGIAQLSDASRQANNITAAGTLLGTPSYMSPEQLRGGQFGPTTDIWSLGVTAYQFFSFRLPFGNGRSDETSFIAAQSILQDEPKPLTEYVPDCPPALAEIIAKMLRKNPADRFQTMDELLPALQAVYDQLTSDQTAGLLAPAFSAAPSAFAPGYATTGQFTSPGTKSTPTSDPFPGPFQGLYQGPHKGPFQGPSTLVSHDYASPPSKGIPEGAGVTRLGSFSPPTGFFGPSSPAAQTGFFKGEQVRYDKIEESLKFYRNNLDSEYQTLSRQARITYYFWIFAVTLGLGALVSGVVLMFLKLFAAGAVTTLSTAFVYFIQKVFQQREDYYRTLATAKHEHLEYGNHWLLVIQSIDSIENPIERQRRQSDLVNVLTQKLGTAQPASRRRSPAPRKKAAKVQ